MFFTKENIDTMIEKIPEEIIEDVLSSDVTTIIIVIVCSVFFLVAMIYLLHSQKCCCFKNQPITEVDAEMAEQITDEKPKVIFVMLTNLENIENYQLLHWFYFFRNLKRLRLNISTEKKFS